MDIFSILNISAIVCCIIALLLHVFMANEICITIVGILSSAISIVSLLLSNSSTDTIVIIIIAIVLLSVLLVFSMVQDIDSLTFVSLVQLLCVFGLIEYFLYC